MENTDLPTIWAIYTKLGTRAVLTYEDRIAALKFCKELNSNLSSKFFVDVYIKD
jgi:hypothetical protein